MVLSILIATVPGRESLLSRLLWILEQQLTDNVEVLVYDGWIPFGDKVNHMRDIAKGEFSVVVDDDDYVSDSYIERVLPRLKNTNYLDHGILHLHNGKFQNVIYSDVVHHKCPIRNSIAKDIKLGNGYTDDKQWSRDASACIGATYKVNQALYIYDYWDTGTVGTEPSDKNKDTQRDVGIYPYNRDVFTWI